MTVAPPVLGEVEVDPAPHFGDFMDPALDQLEAADIVVQGLAQPLDPANGVVGQAPNAPAG